MIVYYVEELTYLFSCVVCFDFMTHNLQVQVTWMLLASFAHGVQPFDNYSSCDEKSKQTTQENKYVSSST